MLFVIDAFGLRPRIEEMADRIAGQGYVVLAPNALYRAGRAPVLPMPDFTDPENRAGFMQSVRPIIEQLTPDAISRDGESYLDFLSTRATRTGGDHRILHGRRVGWRIAAAYPDRVSALGGFHGGGLVTDAPDSPHRSAQQLKAEVYSATPTRTRT